MEIRKEIDKVKKMIQEEQSNPVPDKEYIKKLSRTLMLMSIELSTSQAYPQTKIRP